MGANRDLKRKQMKAEAKKRANPFKTKARNQSERRAMMRSGEHVVITEDQCYVPYKARIMPPGPFEWAVYDEEAGVLALRIQPGRYRNFKTLVKIVNRHWAADGFRLKINNDRSLEAEYIGKKKEVAKGE